MELTNETIFNEGSDTGSDTGSEHSNNSGQGRKTFKSYSEMLSDQENFDLFVLGVKNDLKYSLSLLLFNIRNRTENGMRNEIVRTKEDLQKLVEVEIAFREAIENLQIKL